MKSSFSEKHLLRSDDTARNQKCPTLKHNLACSTKPWPWKHYLSGSVEMGRQLTSKQIESFYGPKKKSQTPAPDPHAPLGDGPCLSFEYHLVFYSSLSIASGPAMLMLSLSDAFSLSIPRVFDSALHLSHDASPVSYTAVLITPILIQILVPRTNHCLLSLK